MRTALIPRILHRLVILPFILVVILLHSQSFTGKAKVVQLDARGKGYLPILTGPPESHVMQSGLVILKPDETVGKHSTKGHEEMLVVLEGEGEMIFADGSKLPVKANSALYCPPQTEHDVKNTGTALLRYVYVVADIK